MTDFHFISDPKTLEVIDEILNLVGSNFTAPYDADSQPSDGVKRNDESLTQYDVPGGTTLKSTQNTQTNPSMGFVISSLLTVLAPTVSAYGFLLPIMGIIKAIIEILCCMMNPFCVIPAVIRLFEKYLPPFVSLFPPSAGVILIKSTIKLILALVYYIMTEIVPTIQLIIDNVNKIIEAFSASPSNEAKAQAGKQKILTVIRDLSNRIGLLAVMKPILEIIFLILQLISGIPCNSGEASSRNIPILGAFAPFDVNNSDCNSCDAGQCPSELSSPPKGIALVTRTSYGDDIPNFVWQLVPLTGQQDIPKLRQYMQDLKSQLDPQLDEEVNVAAPIGSRYDASHLRIRVTGRRENPVCLTHAGDTNPDISGVSFPITHIYENGVVIFRGLQGIVLQGIVDYCIEPNFEQLIANSIISVGCHPRVVAAKEKIRAQFGEIMEQSVLNRYPELIGFDTRFDDFYSLLGRQIARIRAIVDKPISDFSPSDGPAIQLVQDDILSDLLNYANDLNNTLTIIVNRMTNITMSKLTVDKNIVKAGGTDTAVISVIPYDVSGTPVMKNMREDINLDIQIFSNFGIITNKRFNTSTGATLFNISSVLPGTASITAKIGDKFIMNGFGPDTVLATENVRFVADAILPKRRNNKNVSTDLEPGNR